MEQWYCHVGGQRYGPVGADVLRDWVRQGRLGAGHLVWAEGMDNWAAASAVPGLLPPGAPAAGSIIYGRGHRGGAVLALGILAVAVNCFVLGIIAWALARRDLAAMDAGAMDPSGRSLTHAGKILGMIGTIVSLATVTLNLLMLAAMGVLFFARTGL